MLLKKRQKKKWREEKEEYVSSYWTTLRKREDTENLKREHYVALCGEFVLEEAKDLF